MDALSDVLQAVRLTGAIFFDIHASDPWVAETPPGSAIVVDMFPGSEHLVSYHVITQGSGWATVPGEAPVRLLAGDIIVLPHGDTHVLSSTPGLRRSPDMPLRSLAAVATCSPHRHGRSAGEPTHFVWILGCDRGPIPAPRCRA